MENRVETRFQKAIASGEFAKAERLWAGYMATIEQSILGGSASAKDLAAAGKLLDWARLNAVCGRAHSQWRIKALRAALAYKGANSPRNRTQALL